MTTRFNPHLMSLSLQPIRWFTELPTDYPRLRVQVDTEHNCHVTAIAVQTPLRSPQTQSPYEVPMTKLNKNETETSDQNPASNDIETMHVLIGRWGPVPSDSETTEREDEIENESEDRDDIENESGDENEEVETEKDRGGGSEGDGGRGMSEWEEVSEGRSDTKTNKGSEFINFTFPPSTRIRRMDVFTLPGCTNLSLPCPSINEPDGTSTTIKPGECFHLVKLNEGEAVKIVISILK